MTASDYADPHSAADDVPPARTTPLRRDEAVRLLREHAAELERRFNVRPIALFGSVARDEARADSDVDVAVEYVGPVGIDEFVGAAEYLGALFGTRVDMGTLRTLRTLRPRTRAYVERDLVRVA